MTEAEVNKLAARAMRAKMMGRTEEADSLEAELQRAKAALAQACYTPFGMLRPLSMLRPLACYTSLACHTPEHATPPRTGAAAVAAESDLS